jgi:hypothetical protein
VYTVFATYSLSNTLSSLEQKPWYQPSRQDMTCSILLFSNFVKEKKWHFCLFKTVTQGVSL